MPHLRTRICHVSAMFAAASRLHMPTSVAFICRLQRLRSVISIAAASIVVFRSSTAASRNDVRLSLGSQSLAVSTLAQPQPDWGVQRMICGS